MYKKMMLPRTTCVVLFSSALLASCGPQMKVRFDPKPSAEEMTQEVTRVSREAAPQPHAFVSASVGSLWPADDGSFLYADRKALRVGDILTIQVVETATGINSADTDLSRQSGNTTVLKNFFGLGNALKQSNLVDLIEVTSENNHTGKGKTSREGSLTASMTAVVKDRLPNGNLVIQGSRLIIVNHEEQFMTLTGIVRPEDIGRNNVVLSSQIADARIAYGGIGMVADKQRSGWASWAFDWVFPF